MAVEQVFDHKFPSGIGVPLIALAIRLDSLADALAVGPEQWDEDGLGPARGCFIKLTTGRVILLRELEHAIRHLGQSGPVVLVDASDAAQLGLLDFIAEVKAELDLPAEQIAQTPEDADAWRDEAAKSAEYSERRRRGRRE